MINPFPSLLTFSLLAPTLLRIALAAFAIDFGVSKFKKDTSLIGGFFESLGFKPTHYYVKALAVVEILVGIMLLLGLLTQIAALVIAIITFVSFIITIRHPEVGLKRASTYGLLCIVALSLVLTGAGLLAIDLPL